MFMAVDKDRSGQITAKELQVALINSNWSPFNEVRIVSIRHSCFLHTEKMLPLCVLSWLNERKHEQYQADPFHSRQVVTAKGQKGYTRRSLVQKIHFILLFD